MLPDWWSKPRRISVLVDNPSWIVPHARGMVEQLVREGDDARFCTDANEVGSQGIAFFLGCVGLAPRAILDRNPRNLVVHESNLPEGRGFSPLTWQILEGKKEIPVCLLEAAEEADAGPVVYRDTLHFAGHELIDEMRAALGAKTVALCLRFLQEPEPVAGTAQQGVPTRYRRRGPQHSQLDPARSIADQFNLLRVVDNRRYPAFFELGGQRYRLLIEKLPRDEQ